MRSRFGLFFLIVLLIVPVAVHAQDNAWAGNYFISGTDSEGAAYDGGLEIVEIDGRYQLTWLYSDEEMADVGVGLAISDTQMAAAANQTCVVQIFNVGDDGTLSGPWAESFVGLGAETSTPTALMEGMKVGGSYAASGTAPDGSAYSGTLEVTPISDNLYSLAWTLPDFGDYGGVGLLVDNTLVVAADVDPETECGAGVLTMGTDGVISEQWFDEGTTAAYSETAAPITLAGSYTLEGSHGGTLSLSGDGVRYTVELAPAEGDAMSGLAVLRGNVLNMVFGGEQCAVLNRVLMDDGRLFTRSATLTGTTIGMTVQTPEGETDGFIGAYSLAGTAATGATTTGTLTLSGGENGVITGSGEATRSTGETVSLNGVYLLHDSMIVGVYAPGGDVTPCSVAAGVVSTDGTMDISYAAYGETMVSGNDVAAPA